jgi:hypothetical protein
MQVVGSCIDDPAAHFPVYPENLLKISSSNWWFACLVGFMQFAAVQQSILPELISTPHRDPPLAKHSWEQVLQVGSKSLSEQFYDQKEEVQPALLQHDLKNLPHRVPPL